MTPHSADPHVRPAPDVVLPRIVAAPEPSPSDAPAPAPEAPTGWSPTAWRSRKPTG